MWNGNMSVWFNDANRTRLAWVRNKLLPLSKLPVSWLITGLKIREAHLHDVADLETTYKFSMLVDPQGE